MAATSRDLARLEQLAREHGPELGRGKRELVERLDRARFDGAKTVRRFHEALCFMRAYPDDAELLAAVERALVRFGSRADVRRHRAELADSGIAGAPIVYPFFAPTARWLARRWGKNLRLEWAELETKEKLTERLGALALWSETPGLDEADLTLREWVERLKGPDESDAEFLVKRHAALEMDGVARDRFYEELGLVLELRPGSDTPSRTRAKLRGRRLVFQTTPLRRDRPDVLAEIARPPRAIQSVSLAEGRRVIDLAREAMVTRSRDLDAFAYGDPRDVRLIDCGDGLEFAAIGLVPERRLLLEAVYGFLTLKNGVPIGYVLASALFGSSEIAYNVFDTFRGGEAAHVYVRVLAMARALFGADTFTIYPYQLGDHNTEGLKSGAWWFYQKLGFRAREPSVLRLMRAELARMRKNRAHRSSIATLKELARENVYLSLGRERDDVIGLFPLGNVGLAVTDYVAKRFGSDRERAARVCAEEAARLLGVPSRRAWPAGERLSFERWAPLALVLDGVVGWSAADRAALVRVMRAKGGRRESDFVRLLDEHRPLRAALRRLARS